MNRYSIHTLCADAKRRFAVGLYWALAGAVITFANPRVFPTGVTLYDPAHAYNSLVLFGTGQGQSYLIDMNGNEVHHWPQAGFPSGLLDPAVTGGKLGHVVVQLSTMDLDKTGGVVPGEVALFRNKTIGELDWGGKIVWQWGSEAPGGAARQHHDWYRLLNGNTLVLSNVVHTWLHIAKFD